MKREERGERGEKGIWKDIKYGCVSNIMPYTVGYKTNHESPTAENECCTTGRKRKNKT
jgi:hypothetical protein